MSLTFSGPEGKVVGWAASAVFGDKRAAPSTGVIGRGLSDAVCACEATTGKRADVEAEERMEAVEEEGCRVACEAERSLDGRALADAPAG